ncbi:hypothetical protein V8E54_006450, partial [Elaphomyces granulatus]
SLGPQKTSPIVLQSLDLLYKSQGKLDKAERMYQQALQGYEKSLGLENVARHRSALNTISNLVDLFAAQGRLDEVNEMY